MIRREVGAEYWLITQDDHAHISGALARQVGTALPPPSSESAILAIGMHDCGWPIHDERPTLNADHRPLDVFESPPKIALKIWTASVDRAAARDPYAGLLVSLHALSLSVIFTTNVPDANHQWGLSRPRVRFEVNRFQHAMIERQELFRKQLGLRIDRPLSQGLAHNSDDPAEQRLIHDFQLLQGMDQISLCLCCSRRPFEKVNLMSMEVSTAANQVFLDPWPFKVGSIPVEIPFRRVPARPYTDEGDLHAAILSAPAERFTVTLRSRKI